MKNTVIDKEFAALIPPLSDEEFKQLEENILQDGIRDPLVLWGDILVDGHNRYRIAQKHGLQFKTVQKEFANRQEAMAWMAVNQLGRRNIDKITRYELALIAKPVIQEQAVEKAEESRKKFHGNQHEVVSCPNGQDTNHINTRTEIAKIAGIGAGTVARIEAVKKHDAEHSTDLVKRIKSGDMSINEAYVMTRPVPKQRDPKAEVRAAKMEHEDFEKKKDEGSVIGIEEIKNDAENIKTLAESFFKKVTSARDQLMSAIGNYSDSDISKMYSNLDDTRQTFLLCQLSTIQTYVEKINECIHGGNK